MYNPSPFLISTAALTSIFSFFFGGYYRERERAYRYWLRFIAYNRDAGHKDDRIDICSELESMNRMLFQAKGLLTLHGGDARRAERLAVEHEIRDAQFRGPGDPVLVLGDRARPVHGASGHTLAFGFLDGDGLATEHGLVHAASPFE